MNNSELEHILRELTDEQFEKVLSAFRNTFVNEVLANEYLRRKTLKENALIASVALDLVRAQKTEK